MEDLLRSLSDKANAAYIQALADELSKMDTKEIVDLLSSKICPELEDTIKIKSTADGGAKININLTASQIRYVLLKLAEQL